MTHKMTEGTAKFSLVRKEAQSAQSQCNTISANVTRRAFFPHINCYYHVAMLLY